MKRPLSITVITKLKTPNAGNQALTTELIRLVQRVYPDADIYTGWREPGLEQYSFKRLQNAGSDPLNTLDKWAGHIIERYSSMKGSSIGEEELLQTLQPFKASQNRGTRIVEMVPFKRLPLVQRIYNRGLRTLKPYLNYWRIYGRNYPRWIEVLKHSDLIIYSPAGHFGDIGDYDADVSTQDMLGLRIAQSLGVRVAAVNQSMEIKHPLLLRLVGQIYSKFDAVVIRDPLSARLLIDLGVSKDRIKLAPDTAFLAEPAPMEQHELDDIAVREDIKPGTVGISASPKKSFDFSGWGKVIQYLKYMGKQVFFVSNEMSTDMAAGKELQRLYNIKVLSRQYDYSEYIRVLSRMELVISERYHTCVFSAIAGKPFIQLNSRALLKMHGMDYFLEYPIPPVDTTSADWTDIAQNNIEYIYRNYDRLTTSLHETMPRLSKLAKQNVQWESLVTNGTAWPVKKCFSA